MKKIEYYCDRCNKKLGNCGGYMYHRETKIWLGAWGNRIRKEYELCEDCDKDFERWIKIKEIET